MSYAFEKLLQATKTTGSRAIASVVGQVITFTSSVPTNAAVGRLLRIYSSATNDGHYTITAVAGLTVTVAESINASGASGRGVCNDYGPERVVANTIDSFPDTNTIVVSGAQLVSSGVLRGDRFGIYGDAANDGSWFVDKVIDEDTATLVDDSLASGQLTASGASAGSVRITAGYGKLTVTDEATLSWEIIGTSGFAFLDDRQPIGPKLELVRVPTLRTIEIAQTGATSSTWTSTKEVVAPYRSADDTARIYWTFTGASALQSTVELGVSGADTYSYADPSYWFGGSYQVETGKVTAATLHKTHLFGGVLHDCLNMNPGQDSIFRSAALYDSAMVFPGPNGTTGGELTNVSQCSNTGGGIVTFTDDAIYKDFFLIDTSAQGVLVAAATIVISELFLGDGNFTPAFFVALATVKIRDPKEDYALAELFNLISGTGQIEYTWDPRFVSRDRTGLTGNPISGLKVHVYEVNEDTSAESEISGSPFTAGADGRISTDIYLTARRQTSAVSKVEYSQRIVTSGRGYRTMNQVIKMSAPFSGDIAIDYLQTDFEGEVST